jgi:glycosyltransferase involved in cell wall biosynthesis
MSKLKKKHVLILVENLPVPFDRRVWMEATTLQEAGYQVHVVCPTSDRHPESREVLEGVKIRRYPLGIEGRSSLGTLVEYLWALLCMTWHVFAVSLRHPIKVVHVCNPPDLLFLATWPARLIRRAKTIFDQHDLCPELWEVKGHSLTGFYARALLKAEAATYRWADVVISTNESYKHIATTRGKKKSEDVFVVRSAPRKSFATLELMSTRPAHEAHRIAYVGTMGAQEGIDILLDAIKHLITEKGHTQLLCDIIGGGPERDALIELSRFLGLDNFVTFHGRVSDEDMRALIMNADIGVNPDRPSTMNSLSSMNKIVEYMALGVPMVQFDCVEGKRTALESSRYVTEPTAAGLAQAIHDLLGDAQSREQMRTFGLQRFNDVLCWEAQYPNLMFAYTHLAPLEAHG